MFALVFESNRMNCIYVLFVSQILYLDELFLRVSSSRRVGPSSMDPSPRKDASHLGIEDLPCAMDSSPSHRRNTCRIGRAE